MAGQRRAVAAREEAEPVVEASGDAVDTKRGDARRRQFDGERHAVKATANGRSSRRVSSVEHGARVRGMRASAE